MRHFPKFPRRSVPLLLLILVGCSAGASDRSEQADEARRLLQVLDLQAGERVADVGAGDGDWLPPLVRRVGPEGQVFATEVTDALVADLQDFTEREELSTVTVLRGADQHTGLAADCCDAILLRMVYHHFTDPAAMRASLRDALRPGGRVAVVDIAPQKNWRTLEGVPERGGHGIAPDDLIAEMTADGFALESRHDRWNDDPDRFCVVFKKKPLP